MEREEKNSNIYTVRKENKHSQLYAESDYQITIYTVMLIDTCGPGLEVCSTGAAKGVIDTHLLWPDKR